MASRASITLNKIFIAISIILFIDCAMSQEEEVEVHEFVNERESVTLHCGLAREFRSQFVRWYFNDQMLLYKSHVKVSYPVSTDEWMNSTLAITNLSLAHNGSYVCRASNGKLLRTYIVHVHSSCVPCPDQSYCFNGRCCNESGFEMCECDQDWYGERCDSRWLVRSVTDDDSIDEARVQQLVVACSVVGAALMVVAAMVFICKQSSSSKKEIVKDEDDDDCVEEVLSSGCHVEEQHQFRRTTESKSPLLSDKNSCIV